MLYLRDLVRAHVGLPLTLDDRRAEQAKRQSDRVRAVIRFWDPNPEEDEFSVVELVVGIRQWRDDHPEIRG